MGGWKRTNPTVYVVSWPAGVFKVGYSERQRWRRFELRGASLHVRSEFPTSTLAFAEEDRLDELAAGSFRRAFPSITDEARAMLGQDGAGYRECFRGDVDAFLAMLTQDAPAYASASCVCNAPLAKHGRTDGRTNAEASSPTGDNTPSVTRTRTYGIRLEAKP